jgi:hypothetical protein
MDKAEKEREDIALDMIAAHMLTEDLVSPEEIERDAKEYYNKKVEIPEKYKPFLDGLADKIFKEVGLKMSEEKKKVLKECEQELKEIKEIIDRLRGEYAKAKMA